MLRNMDAVLQRSRACLLAGLLFFIISPALAAPKEDLGVSLAFAAAAGAPAEVKTLLEKGAKPDSSRNSVGVPALSLAAQRRDKNMAPVADLLLKGGASIEIEDKNGQTPLFYAAKSGNTEGVKFLLARGADFYHADSAKRTARDVASAEGKKDIVTLMDEHVRNQTSEVLKQYEERNKEIADRNAAIVERNKELVERDKKMQAQHQQIKENFDRKAAMEEAAKEAAARRAAGEKRRDEQDVNRITRKKTLDTDKLEETLRRMSYHTCASEYWKFLRRVKQENEFTREEMKIQQDAHDTLTDEAITLLRKEFRASDVYMLRVVNPTVKQIKDDMKLHATNANRKAEGIGTRKDMDERCSDIADQWELEGKGHNLRPPPPPPKQVKKRPALRTKQQQR